MGVYEDKRDLLIQKNVHLVQSGQFKSNINDLTKKDIKGINDIIRLDYMGSFEFECGSLPKSLRRMTINKNFYKVFVFDQYKDKNGNSLKVYAPYVFYKNVLNIVNRLSVDGCRLQEYCSLADHIIKAGQATEDMDYDYYDEQDFWWDIENDFFMFFEHTDKVLDLMDALRKEKFGYEKNKADSTLNKAYLDLLTRPNTRFIDMNTSIKNYRFNKNNNMHLIEFLEGATLENIFMEAIIIAKTAKGNVLFNVNGIPFSINEESIPDIIKKENGVDLVDSCTYSDKIDELINEYHEEVERKQKQSELVNVLRLIRNQKANK
ncbi:MAG: hypothetical protein J5892_03950 [Bacilli bacterium]|nr:hypothetical protein [Bacilli bacterium]